MAMLNEIRIPTSPKVESEALALLIGQLGPAKAAFFLRDHFSRHTDYLDFKEDTFGTESVDVLAQKISLKQNH